MGTNIYFAHLCTPAMQVHYNVFKKVHIKPSFSHKCGYATKRDLIWYQTWNALLSNDKFEN